MTDNDIEENEAASPKVDEENEEEKLIGRMEDEALKRKERLKALKSGQIDKIKNRSDNESDMITDVALKPIFRNYTPSDDTLKPGVLPKPNLIEIENEIKEQLENARPQALIESEIDLATLAPQKIDWDLKRDAEKKLKILEKRTQNAIIELIKDRLKETKSTDFAELVSVGSRQMGSSLNRNAKQVNVNDVDDEDEDWAQFGFIFPLSNWFVKKLTLEFKIWIFSLFICQYLAVEFILMKWNKLNNSFYKLLF